MRWRCADLQPVLSARHGVDLWTVSIGRVLKPLTFSPISARPRHPAQDPQAIESYKKVFPALVERVVERLAPATPVEVWFQDERRVGQKNGLVYQ